MKLTSLTCMLALAGAVTAGAQSSESTTRTKVEVKDGKNMKVTGCVASDGAGYMLLRNCSLGHLAGRKVDKPKP